MTRPGLSLLLLDSHHLKWQPHPTPTNQTGTHLGALVEIITKRAGNEAKSVCFRVTNSNLEKRKCRAYTYYNPLEYSNKKFCIVIGQ